MEEWLRRQRRDRKGEHGNTLPQRDGPVGALAHLAHRVGWRAALAVAAVASMALAFLLVVAAGGRQSEQRRRAEAELQAANAACEAGPSHQERTRCRAGLHPLPRDNAGLAGWTPDGR